jgi:hypothetical protein
MAYWPKSVADRVINAIFWGAGHIAFLIIQNTTGIKYLKNTQYSSKSVSVLSSGLRLGLSRSGFRSEILQANLIASVHKICLAHLILPDFITLTVHNREGY